MAGFDPSCHSPWSHEMNNDPCSEQFEVVYGFEAAASKRCLMPGAESKSVRWIMDLVANFSDPTDLVVTFVGGQQQWQRHVSFCLSNGALLDVKRMKVVSIKPHLI